MSPQKTYALIEELHSLKEPDIIELAGVLLRCCRRQKVLLLSVYSTPAQFQRLARASLLAQEFFEAHRSERLDQEDQKDFLALLHTVLEETGSEAVAARAAAEGLHDVLGHRFSGCLEERAFWDPDPDEPFLVTRPNLLGIFDHLNSRDSRLSDPVDELPNLRLMPSHGSLRAQFLQDKPGVLANFQKGSGIGIGILNEGPSDFEWDRFVHEGQSLFFRVRPKDPRQQEERLLHLLQQADRAHLELLLLPELCLTQELMDKVQEWFKTKRRHLAILVPGSCHIPTEGEQRGINHTLALLPGGSRIEHDKFNPFVLTERRKAKDGTPLPDVEWRENLVPGERFVRIGISANWSFATVICKDIMFDETARLLSDLAVNLVFIPAFSEKTEFFESHARYLASEAQAIVLVANTCGPRQDDGPHVAMVSLPIPEPCLRKWPRIDCKPPILLRISLGSREMLTIA